MSNCPNCGHQNPAGTTFCNNCGAQLQVYASTKKKGLSIPAIIGIRVAVVVLIFGGLYMLGNNDPEYKTADKLELADIEGTWDLVGESKSGKMTDQIKINEDEITTDSGDKVEARYSSVTDDNTLIIADSNNIFTANYFELRLERRKVDGEDRVVLAVYVDSQDCWGYYVRK